MISFHEISPGSLDWKEVLTHRDRILRKPLGLSLSTKDTLNEKFQRHFVLRDGSRIIAGLISFPAEEGCIKLRQMWVHEDHEGNGLGRRLLREVAELLASEGTNTLTLHARMVVRPFYEKCGYLATGQVFTEIGIPHIKMKRQLNRPTEADRNAPPTRRNPDH